MCRRAHKIFALIEQKIPSRRKILKTVSQVLFLWPSYSHKPAIRERVRCERKAIIFATFNYVRIQYSFTPHTSEKHFNIVCLTFTTPAINHHCHAAPKLNESQLSGAIKINSLSIAKCPFTHKVLLMKNLEFYCTFLAILSNRWKSFPEEKKKN
jgi:hypothetical protein